MNLDLQNWQPFRIDKLFDIYTGGDLIMGDLEEGNIPIASNSSENNNIAAYTDYIEGRKLFDHTISISVADRGKFWAFIQPKDFYLATRVKGLVCKDYNLLNEYQMAFVVSVLNQESFKFSYGRNCCAHLPDVKIYLPIKHNSDGSLIIDNSNRWSDEGYIPDWRFMEDYIKSLHHKPLTTKNKRGQAPDLNVNEWEYFLLKDICNISMGNKMDATAMTTDEPKYNFVGRSADNNGVAMKVDAVYNEDGTLIEPYPEGSVTVALGGSLGSTYLQKEPFYTSQNVAVLQFSNAVSDSAKLFLCTLIHNESLYKYFPFGRELNTHIRNDFGFTLPVDSKNNPDWQFMEEYIKSLPYGDRLEG